MTKIAIVGGTGYAGHNIVQAAADKGWDVTSYSRKEPTQQIEGVTYRLGSATDPDFAPEVVEGQDAVVVALSPRGDMEGKLVEAVQHLAEAAAHAGARLGVVGGAGSLKVSEEGPLVVDTPDFPDAVRPEALEMGRVLDELKAEPEPLDWFYVSPAGGFGAFNPGEKTGKYRVGKDVLLVDSDGASNISGADFAQAVVDEIATPAHSRERFTVAY